MKLVAVGVAIASSIIPLQATKSMAATAPSFEGLNVFGDSLVDSGNLFNLTSAFSPQGIPALPPSPPYAQKLSNGPIWIDNVGQALGLSPTLSTQFLLDPNTPPPTQGISFAFAGALSSNLNVSDDDIPPLASFLPGFQEQVAAFATLSAVIPANPNALNVVWVGGNDYNEAFFNPASLGGLSLEQLPNSVTDNIIDGLTQLSSSGAKKFLVVNLPSLGEVPFADFLDAQTPQDIPSILNQLTATHNKLLSEKLNAFGQSHTDVDVIELDVATLFADLSANPGAFGLTNVTDPCLTNFQPGFQFEGICDNPNQFLFWDDVHPTTAAYKLVSDLALERLSPAEPSASVPEPTSLAALFMVGLAGFTLAKRRRPQVSAVRD
ncbi:MAG: SGNH/GDSL hydrolase family protein [Phormidesmis sp.]